MKLETDVSDVCTHRETRSSGNREYKMVL
jgi:hypothetical protein